MFSSLLRTCTLKMFSPGPTMVGHIVDYRYEKMPITCLKILVKRLVKWCSYQKLYLETNIFRPSENLYFKNFFSGPNYGGPYSKHTGYETVSTLDAFDGKYNSLQTKKIQINSLLHFPNQRVLAMSRMGPQAW